jgi:PEP-CTERM motif-containing protein
MTTLLVGVVLLLGALSPVSADTIGIAVSSVGSSAAVGTAAPDGTISFFIPLTSAASGTYGVSGKGTSSDSCTTPNCLGGSLEMFLRFAPVQVGANVLTLDFSDLDLIGANDPTYFLESILISPNGSGPGVLIDDRTDPGVLSANTGSQVLVLPMAVASNPFYVQLHFTSKFLTGTPSGTYTNTVETVKATIRPVPEPLTLVTLGLGLLVIGILGGRKKGSKFSVL